MTFPSIVRGLLVALGWAFVGFALLVGLLTLFAAADYPL
jgi:hypothetical protein